MRSSGGAPAIVFDLIRRHAIDCEARQNGTLRAAVAAKHAAAIRITAEQLRAPRRPGRVPGARGARRAPREPSRYNAAMLDRRGGDLNPLSFARGLARAAIGAGAAVHGGTPRARPAARGRRVAARAPGAAPSAHRTWCSRPTATPTAYGRGCGAPSSRCSARSQRARRLPQQIARAVMPGRSVLYESGAITVYYRIDAGRAVVDRRPGTDARDPQRGGDSASARLCAKALADSRGLSNGRMPGAGGWP